MEICLWLLIPVCVSVQEAGWPKRPWIHKYWFCTTWHLTKTTSWDLFAEKKKRLQPIWHLFSAPFQKGKAVKSLWNQGQLTSLYLVFYLTRFGLVRWRIWAEQPQEINPPSHTVISSIWGFKIHPSSYFVLKCCHFFLMNMCLTSTLKCPYYS